ncbi:threonine synthase [Candidatus Aenigmatarchaeota archaeon]
MHERFILCSECGKKYPAGKQIFRCECGNTPEIVFDYNKIKKGFREKIAKRDFNHSRYLELYPVKKLVSIHEGGTPLIRSKNIEKSLGLKFELYFKYEAQNPTGSFKDRGSSVEIAKAVESGAKKVVCASTGNMGASLSAYSGMANLKCVVFTPMDARIVKLEQMLAYGADVYKVRGDYVKAARIAEEINRKRGTYLLGDYMHRREGTKSIGFELCEQLPGMDYVFSPIGNGTLISATWKAMNEFRTLGMLKKRPRMVGIQASGCSTVARAYMKGSQIRPVKSPHTIAVAIECGDPIDGRKALSAINKSGGFADSVSDNDILKTRELLARKEGLFAEPAGAVSLAGLIKNKSRVQKGSKVVCILTGHGLKTPMTGVRGKVKKPLKSML